MTENMLDDLNPDQLRAVITSYSIHYTKLYDETERGAGGFGHTGVK